MFRKNRCYNGGNKHLFKPRYGEKEKQYNFKSGVPHVFMSDEALRRVNLFDAYICDVCVWCGKIIERK
jgi:hypothetical protein